MPLALSFFFHWPLSDSHPWRPSHRKDYHARQPALIQKYLAGWRAIWVTYRFRWFRRQCLVQKLPVCPFIRRLLLDGLAKIYIWAAHQTQAKQRSRSLYRKVSGGWVLLRYTIWVVCRSFTRFTDVTGMVISCYITKWVKDDKRHSNRERKYQRTDNKTCEKCTSVSLDKFASKTRAFIDSIQRCEGTIADNLVDNGHLFGMVEVDIEIPVEMSPLFCTSDIPIGNWQSYMGSFRKVQPVQRLLVGGMKARQILLATPLLKWYRNHRLIVAFIYQVVEFQSKRYFRQFVHEVSEAWQSHMNGHDLSKTPRWLTVNRTPLR